MIGRAWHRSALTLGIPRRGLALGLLCLAPFLGVFDTSVVAIALPAMQRDLGFAASDVPWVLNGYALTFGGLLLLGGRLADVLGRRRVFMAGASIFALASLAAGLAVAPWLLVAARAMQGVGAAAMAPASLALVATLFAEPARRDRALGAYGAMTGVGFIAGIVLGGVLTERLNWRWVLFATVPIALAALLPAPMVIPESRDSDAPRSFDLPGATTAICGVALLIYALSSFGRDGWTSWSTAGVAAIGVGLLVGFVAIEHRAAAPLMPLAVFQVRQVAVADAVALLKGVVGIGQLYVLTLYFQQVLGHPPIHAGLLFVPMALASVAAGTSAGPLATRLGFRTTAALGLLVLAIGLLLMARLGSPGMLRIVLIGTIVAEVGFMLAHVPLTIVAATGLSACRRGLAAGLLGTANQLGNALGLGVVATLVAAHSGAPGDPAEQAALAGALRDGLVVLVAAVALALLLVLVGLRSNTRPDRGREGNVSLNAQRR